MFKNMRLGAKLLLAFLLVGVLPFATVAIISMAESTSAISQQTYNQLKAVRDIKHRQIGQYFKERQGDMGVLVDVAEAFREEAVAKLEAVHNLKKIQVEDYFEERLLDTTVFAANPTVIAAAAAFEAAFEAEGDRVGGEKWKAAEATYGPWLAELKKSFGYYDALLIAMDGDVIYTIAKESDLGQNIRDGALRTSSLGKCFQEALERSALADFQPYAPSNDEPAAFFGAPIRQGRKVIGVLALQVSIDEINGIMQQREGLGKSGETYLVGPDKRMRSDSILDAKNRTVKASFAGTVDDNGVDTEATRQALSGKEDHGIILDYRGEYVLSAYGPVKVGGLTWALVAELDVAEALVPTEADGSDFYSRYKEKYGYYDVFVMNPDGFVFHSVTKQSDYRTNMVTGKYAKSNLGRLVQEVRGSKKFGFVDFEPYAPSDDAPAAFIAQPTTDRGQVTAIIGLQIPLDAINAIMMERNGMGQTGETYLVGHDKLMRSDSFLDAINHSVAASFANPTTGSVDTAATREALAGTTAEKVIDDYRGNPVLSAYRPLEVFGTRWVVIAEIDEAEAFAAVSMLTWLILVVALIGIACIVTVAVLLTLSISRPINAVVERMTEAGEQIAAASRQVSEASQQMAAGANEQASSLEEVSASLEEMSAMTQQNAANAQQSDEVSRGVRGSVVESRTSVAQLGDAMGDIKRSSDETAKIVKTIDEIAFQTNMLALNAAVEAARAGDAGKGFAVVADEVRNLALRSAEAAKDTAALIEMSQNSTRSGVAASGTVSGALDGIVGQVEKVSELTNEVASASGEQARGIEQVNTAVAQMNRVTQANAASAEESAASSEELSAQAVELNDMVQMLAAVVRGAGANGNGSHGVPRRASNGRAKKRPYSQERRPPRATRVPDTNGEGWQDLSHDQDDDDDDYVEADATREHEDETWGVESSKRPVDPNLTSF